MDDGGRTWVRGFAEAGEPLADLLGSKGAGLAGMTRLGLPVPPGFTLTTDVCRHHLEHGTTPSWPGGRTCAGSRPGPDRRAPHRSHLPRTARTPCYP